MTLPVDRTILKIFDIIPKNVRMVTLLTIVLVGCDIAGHADKLQRLSGRSAAHQPGWHVYPGKSIQEAMEVADRVSDGLPSSFFCRP